MRTQIKYTLIPATMAVWLATGLLLSACTSSGSAASQRVDTDNPKLFAQELFRICHENDYHQWEEQLTTERRELGEAYVRQHFDNWRALMLQLETGLGAPVAEVEFRVDGSALQFYADSKWNTMIHVAQRDGVLRINQD